MLDDVGTNKTLVVILGILGTGTVTSIIQAVGAIFNNDPSDLAQCLSQINQCHEGVREISKLCIADMRPPYGP